MGLYISDRDAEEGELLSDVEPPGPSASVSQPDPCVRKPTQPAPVFAPKPKEVVPAKEVAPTKETSATAAVPSTSKEPKTKSKAPAKPRAKPQSKVQKLKSQLQTIVPVAPAPTLEQAQQAIRRTRSVTTHKLVRQAVKLDRIMRIRLTH